jgi:hypothetical protein
MATTGVFGLMAIPAIADPPNTGSIDDWILAWHDFLDLPFEPKAVCRPPWYGELPGATPVTVITIAQERTILPSSKLTRDFKAQICGRNERKLLDTPGLFNI